MTAATEARLEQIIALSWRNDTLACSLIRDLATRALADERAQGVTMVEENIEEGEHMPTTPDHSYIITALAGTEPYKTGLAINSAESILAFMQEAGKQLYALDPKWGYLSASPAERKVVQLPNNQTIAADSFIYATTMQEVHVLKNVLEKKKQASPHWVLMPGMQENTFYPIQGEADTGESA